MKQSFRIWLISFLVFLLGACRAEGVVPTPTLVATPLAVEKPTYTVQRGTITKIVQLNGRVTPVQQQELYFRSAGFVKEVLVEIGDTVEEDDVLIRLDEPEQYQADVVSAQLAVAQGQADLERAKIETPIRFAQARITLDQAAKDLQKATNALAALQSTGASQDRVDAAHYQADLAQALYDQAVAVVAYWQTDNPIGEIALAELRLDEAETRLSLALKAQAAIELRAPFAGEILSLGVVPGSSVSAFQAVVTLADPSELEITAVPSVDDLQLMGIGQEVSVRLSSQSGEALPGKITGLPLGTLSSSNNQAVHISLEDETPALNLGEAATIQVVIDTRQNALWLPPAAIRSFQGQDFVFVESNGVQRRVNVVVGLQASDRVEIISGLEEGQTVVGQ